MQTAVYDEDKWVDGVLAVCRICVMRRIGRAEFAEVWHGDDSLESGCDGVYD